MIIKKGNKIEIRKDDYNEGKGKFKIKIQFS